jgi:O-antigen ligase
LAFYCNIAIAVLLVDYITRRLSLFSKDIHYLFLMFVFTFFSLILLSRMGIATSMFLVGILLVYWFYKRKWLISVFAFLFLTLTPLIMIKSSIWARERLWDELATEKVEEGREIISLTTLRMEIWDDALTVYQKSPIIGFGTGDGDQALLDQYQTDNFQQAIEENLNPHNQFIQTGIAIGALGILLVLAILFYPFSLWKKQYVFGLMFSAISFMFFMTESVLEKQSGVVAFSIFYCLFLLFDGVESANKKLEE